MQKENKSLLFSRPIAHRGLWGDNAKENSLSAYRHAVEKGYPIEIDLYLTCDNRLVCFHDKTLKRVFGIEGFIYEKSYKELEKLGLFNTQEKIPLLEEVLRLVEGKVPLLIELKNQPKKDYVERVVNALKDYKGEYALQSFNPLYMLKVKKLAPNVLRGILTTQNAKSEGESAFNSFIVKRMPLNFLVKPNFISCEKTALKKIKKTALPLLCWTVKDKKEFEKVKPYCENIIFENFIPEE